MQGGDTEVEQPRPEAWAVDGVENEVGGAPPAASPAPSRRRLQAALVLAFVWLVGLGGGLFFAGRHTPPASRIVATPTVSTCGGGNNLICNPDFEQAVPGYFGGGPLPLSGANWLAFSPDYGHPGGRGALTASSALRHHGRASASVGISKRGCVGPARNRPGAAARHLAQGHPPDRYLRPHRPAVPRRGTGGGDRAGDRSARWRSNRARGSGSRARAIGQPVLLR